MITTVKTRKKIQKDQDPDRGLDQTRKREKSHVRKKEIRGKISKTTLTSPFERLRGNSL